MCCAKHCDSAHGELVLLTSDVIVSKINDLKQHKQEVRASNVKNVSQRFNSGPKSNTNFRQL